MCFTNAKSALTDIGSYSGAAVGHSGKNTARATAGVRLDRLTGSCTVDAEEPPDTVALDE